MTVPSQTEAPILQMRGIGKRFPGVIALNAVDISIRRGEVLALIGENGAGKSTLMKILGGVYRPDSGEIFINGESVTIESVSDAIRYGISFIHQELNVVDNLDVAGNVFLGREPVVGGPLKLVDRGRMAAEAQPYLDRLGLKVTGKTPLVNLSIAEQQMVEIAKALSLRARILIMDEPTSSLTLTETERLLEVVLELRAQGVSIIYISHRLGEIAVIADRVAGLRDGSNAGGLNRDQISHDAMVKMMVGRDIDQFYVHGTASASARAMEVKEIRTRRYPGKTVSFRVRQGEILGFAGLVGAGRTEVAQAIFGVVPALEGSINWTDGLPLKIQSPRDAIDQGIYLIPEDRRHFGLIVEMSIRQNITLPALERYSRGNLIDTTQEKQQAEELCARLGVRAPSPEVIAANLSGGNQQKVVLAKWVSLEPKLFIFDEPTRGIDVGAKAEIYKLMRSLADQGVAIMMISSDMEEVLGVSDRIAVMHEGSITGILERPECTEEAVMQLAVGGGPALQSRTRVHNPEQQLTVDG